MNFTTIVTLTTCTLVSFVTTTISTSKRPSEESTVPQQQVPSTPKSKTTPLTQKSFLAKLCSCCSVEEPLEEQEPLVEILQEGVSALKSRIQNFQKRVNTLGRFYYDLYHDTKPKVQSIIMSHNDRLTKIAERTQSISEGLLKISDSEEFAELLQEWEGIEQELETLEDVIYTPYQFCMKAKRLDAAQCNRFVDEVMGREEGKDSEGLVSYKQNVQKKVSKAKRSQTVT